MWCFVILCGFLWKTRRWIMGRKPEEYARLLASALSKLHAAETRGHSPLLSPDSVQLISATIECVISEVRAETENRSKLPAAADREPILLH
jgi:hypothetical protein